MAILKAIKYVDEVILEESWDQNKKDVQKNMMLMFLLWVMIGRSI